MELSPSLRINLSVKKRRRVKITPDYLEPILEVTDPTKPRYFENIYHITLMLYIHDIGYVRHITIMLRLYVLRCDELRVTRLSLNMKRILFTSVTGNKTRDSHELFKCHMKS